MPGKTIDSHGARRSSVDHVQVHIVDQTRETRVARAQCDPHFTPASHMDQREGGKHCRHRHHGVSRSAKARQWVGAKLEHPRASWGLSSITWRYKRRRRPQGHSEEDAEPHRSVRPSSPPIDRSQHGAHRGMNPGQHQQMRIQGGHPTPRSTPHHRREQGHKPSKDRGPTPGPHRHCHPSDGGGCTPMRAPTPIG